MRFLSLGGYELMAEATGLAQLEEQDHGNGHYVSNSSHALEIENNPPKKKNIKKTTKFLLDDLR